MLILRNVTIRSRKDDRLLVDDLSFTLHAGERAALIGEEGNGKSTLLKWIFDPKIVEGYAEASGQCVVDGKLGYLPQELPGEDTDLPVCAYLEGACSYYALSPREVNDVAQRLGLSPALFDETRPMGTLSGGERVKVQLAALLLSRCDILLLDEPSNDLDIETLEWLSGFMNAFPGAVLYISHDEVLLEETADTIVHLEQVRRKTICRCTVSREGYRAYMDQRARQFAHQEQVARFEKADFQKKKDRYLSIYNAVEHAQESLTRQDPSTGRLLKKKMHTVKSMGRRLDKEEESLTQLPEAEWAILPKWEPGIELSRGKVVLDYLLNELRIEDKLLSQDIHLKIVGPEKVCILGPNGCGKSTLMDQIAQELLSRKDIRCTYMPQRYGEGVSYGMKPEEYLAPDGDKESVTKARIYLGSMKYTTEEMSHPVSDLSGGQRAKLLLLKAILNKSNVLLLDEPTRNFSPLSCPAVRQLLASFPGCILSVSHDRRYIEEVTPVLYTLTESGLKRIYR
ncbi:MAG: ABC-F family ATP-binding cassette domain-containing protein [Clostridia bacterium]|nr:ABC-F family ATP-binding cassette domain-containing protein [Clostridia bacterium]